uniref:ARAD1B04664p n=1 Tax=Blastobotrys adeninivorans TaxID=409370 RepID=A0A060TB07_BLAAD
MTAATATATVSPAGPPAFCFPAPNHGDSSGSSSSSGGSRNRGFHSRQYTVDLSWLNSASSEAGSSTSMPPPSRSPHRGHAHRRSGALSVHDLSGLDLPQPRHLGPALSLQKPSSPGSGGGLYSQQKASLSASSLPMPPSSSRSDSNSDSPSPRLRVSFAEPKDSKDSRELRGSPHSQSPSETSPTTCTKTPPTKASPTKSCPTTNSIPTLSPPETADYERRGSMDSNSRPKQSRHKKVKSWAGSLMRRHDHKSKTEENSDCASDASNKAKDALTSSDIHLHSSSYVPATNTSPVSTSFASFSVDRPPAPVIDLAEAELAEPSMLKFKPTESSPRTGDSIIEEEEEEDDEQDRLRTPPTIGGASSSAVSLQSTASATYNRDRGRYARRSYSSGLLAQAYRSRLEQADPIPAVPAIPTSDAAVSSPEASDDDEPRQSALISKNSEPGSRTESKQEPKSEPKQEPALNSGPNEPKEKEQVPIPRPRPRTDNDEGRRKRLSLIRLRRGSNTSISSSFSFAQHRSGTPSILSTESKRSLSRRMFGWMRKARDPPRNL